MSDVAADATGVAMHATRCAICNTADAATELYPANFDAGALNAAVFSARRLPDRVHFRMVTCDACGLVRSDPVAASSVLGRLYKESAFNYGDEVANLQRTYGRYLAELEELGVRKGRLLEIGCGNGFFLEEAAAQGYADVRGVEPSRAAVAAASPERRPGIVCDVMRPGLFDAASFDVICLFQVLDHLPEPAALLDECFRLLRPGGLMLCLNHDVGALSARVLRDRSPIVDIEHTYLYDRRTMARLFAGRGFRVRRVRGARNTYTLQYVARLVPLPSALKRGVLGALRATRLGRARVAVALGNQYLVAQKPA
ncbi:MAG: class I SAM-dependent methyltransferase [Gemmatimonadaceae bacterium]